MELKEIRKIVREIAEDIEKNKINYTYRSYDSFLDKIGMGKKRNFPILQRFDYQIKKHNLTMWLGKEKIYSLTEFKRGQTMVFKEKETVKVPVKKTPSVPKATIKVQESRNSGELVRYENAGTVHVSKSISGIVPYDHQAQAFYNLDKKIIDTNKNPFAGLLVLPTGGGKTLTAGMWLAKNYLDKGKKVLWIAHRHELLDQAKSTFSEKLAFSDIFEKKASFNYRIISGIHDKPVNIKSTDDLIISSKDSLNGTGFNSLYNNWIKGNTDEIFLVIDEAHHATAKTYRKLIQKIQEKVSHFQMLGLTATPFRTQENERGFLKKVFPDDIVYKVDLKRLIRLGILSEPRFEYEATGLNFLKDLSEKQIENLNYFDIDKIGSGVAKSIAENAERNYIIVKKYIDNKEKYKQTIVFALNIENAIALNAMFRKEGVKSDFVISAAIENSTGVTTSTKENKDKIARFRNEELEVLINVNILTEGTDVPNVQSVFLARPTISAILMTQMIGRGLRGLKAGGTKEAYIVSFIDEWQNKVSWVNPEKLFIEDNIDFNDADVETRKQIFRLVALNKLEEFAIITGKKIDAATLEQIEKLDFIERFPVGIYQFRFYQQHQNEETVEKICEVLVYDNILQAYEDFITALPSLFDKFNLTERNMLREDELEVYARFVEKELFHGTLKYPAYHLDDIKNVLQYYAVQGEAPIFIELKDREKYDVRIIAKEIIDKDLTQKAQTELINAAWENNEIEWQTFCNYEKKVFIREIDLAKNRINHPEEYSRIKIQPTEEKELRSLEQLDLQELSEHNPLFEKWIRDEVYRKYTDSDGRYFTRSGSFKSRNKLDFQVKHIVPLSKGGLTIMDNLQLVKREEWEIEGNMLDGEFLIDSIS